MGEKLFAINEFTVKPNMESSQHHKVIGQSGNVNQNLFSDQSDMWTITLNCKIASQNA